MLQQKCETKHAALGYLGIGMDMRQPKGEDGASQKVYRTPWRGEGWELLLKTF